MRYSGFLALCLGLCLVSAQRVEAQEAAPQHTNRLAGESSPYLLLHAHNPVDWYPWGPEALEKAQKEQKPIFLSIGYSSCYWCHVMERQVFENEAIAAYMNEHFINIKVDREERPDLDDVYMLSLQVYFQLAQSNQSGGWPLSMFLTPDGKPIAGGTYFPPEDRPGMPGFRRVLENIHTVWTTRQADVQGTADLLASEVARLSKPQLMVEDTSLSINLTQEVIAAVKAHHDPEFGGLDFDPDQPDSPKFPVPSRLELLQSPAGRMPDAESLQMVDLMLDQMAAGGIHDHLGGGFHRYSTERRWLVPHFEKMLYDNVQLIEIYVDAYRRTNRIQYKQVAEQMITFVDRDLSDSSGVFYSALDAETNGIEGQYYVWEQAEVSQLLGERAASQFQQAYGLNQPQTFEHGYILHLPVPVAEVADKLQISVADLEHQLAASRQILLQARQQRPALLKDDKVLTSWNGLAIRAYANAGRILQNKAYVARAEQAALTILSTMRTAEGRLQRTSRGGKVSLNAYLDDYAFLISGLLALHAATGEEKWLNAARRLTDSQIELFWDEQAGGFFFTTHDHETLIARTKSAYDSALPAGNSVSARNLVRLSVLTKETKYREYAEQTLRTFVPQLRRAPTGMSHLAVGIAEYLAAYGTPTQLALGADPPATQPNPQPLPPTTPAPTAAAPLVVAASPKVEEALQHEQLKAQAYLSANQVTVGSTVQVAVVIQVAEGWHINANPAQPDFVIPTTLQGTTASGGKLTAASYPAGHVCQVEGIDDALSVYEGQVIIRGTLTIPPDAQVGEDELKITLRYQACNNKNCLRPVNLVLSGKIKIAATGTPFEAVNGTLFPAP